MLVKDLMKKGKVVPPMKLVKEGDGFKVASSNFSISLKTCKCCCHGHCSLAKDYHSQNGKVSGVNLAKMDVKPEKNEFEFPNLFEEDLIGNDVNLAIYSNSTTDLEFNDPLHKMLMAMETNFSLEN